MNAFDRARQAANKLRRLERAEQALTAKVHSRYAARRQAILDSLSAHERVLLQAAQESEFPTSIASSEASDVEALQKLRACIDEHLAFPSVEHEENGDYESAVEYAALRLRELQPKPCTRVVDVGEAIRKMGQREAQEPIPARPRSWFTGEEEESTVDATERAAAGEVVRHFERGGKLPGWADDEVEQLDAIEIDRSTGKSRRL